MTWRVVLGFAAIVVLVAVFIPTIDILRVQVTIPPSDQNIAVLHGKITILQKYTTNLANITTGTNEVIIAAIDGSGKEVFNQSYLVGQGTYVITTLQTISRGDIAIVRVPQFQDFKKVIPIE